MNIVAIIAISVLDGIFGLLALMFIICGVDAKHKIGGAVFCIALGVLMIGGTLLEAKADQNAWNGGQCSKCGGEWSLVAVSRSHNTSSSTYYYECEDCRNTISTSGRQR